jgi:class 3 adenylate cyclase
MSESFSSFLFHEIDTACFCCFYCGHVVLCRRGTESWRELDLRGIIGAYHRCATELVERNGGFVAKYMGAGVLAYFGYPQTHEHDAEHAVRAGLALVEAVPKLACDSSKRDPHT